MKARLVEYNEAFLIQLTAEDMSEAATIARFGINATKELMHKSARAYKEGEFSATISIGKRKQPKNVIQWTKGGA